MEIICCGSAVLTLVVGGIVWLMQKSGYSDAMNELRRRERKNRD